MCIRDSRKAASAAAAGAAEAVQSVRREEWKTMSDHLTSVWIVGAGAMAVEYAKVLSALEKQYTVVGRSEERCRTFEEKTGHKAVPGGLDAFLASQPTVCLLYTSRCV